MAETNEHLDTRNEKFKQLGNEIDRSAWVGDGKAFDKPLPEPKREKK